MNNNDLASRLILIASALNAIAAVLVFVMCVGLLLT